jgi:multiple sugar transport system ATP-binding protein
MTVAENMGFALKIAKIDKATIAKRVEEAAKLLELTEYLGRKPKALSGGQRQRVAMGRAIVREPKVFLMDEPLSNLDAKLRVQTRAELIKLHQRLQTTVIYVTHDQTEAMTMGSRIAVLRDGVLQQLDTPQTVYDHPSNMFVAGFIGSPAMNFFPSELATTEGQMTVDTGAFQLNVPTQYQPKLKSFGKSSVILGLRPEDMYDRNWAPNLPELSPARMKVDVVEHLGNEMFAYLIAGNHSPTARLDSRTDVSAGDTIDLVLDASRIHAFDPATQEALF